MKVVKSDHLLTRESASERARQFRAKTNSEKRRLQKDTRMRILEFYVNPRNQLLIQQAHARPGKTHDNLLWNALFQHVFGECPTDPGLPQTKRLSLWFKRVVLKQSVAYPGGSPLPGQTDPRWDDLFGIRAGFRAQAWAINKAAKLKVQEKQSDCPFVHTVWHRFRFSFSR